MIIRDLIFNAALLISLSMLYNWLSHARIKSATVRLIFIGLLFGSIALVSMLFPYPFAEGIFLDGRSIVISVAGFVGGWIPAGIAAAIALGYRIFQGGSGAFPAVLGILGYASLGIGYRSLIQKFPRLASPLYVYFYGVIVHLLMFAGMFFLPQQTATQIIKIAAAPIMIIFPLVSLAVIIMLGEFEQNRKTEISLRESEERYRSLFTDNNSVMLLVDPKSAKILDANQAACHYYGWTHSEITRKRITQINPMSADEIQAEMEKAKKEGRKFFEFLHTLANGFIRDVEVYISPITIAGRSLLYYIVHDITSRKHIERALKEAQRRYREILENVEMIAVMLDEAGAIIFCNQYLLNLTGWQEDEILGKNWFDIFIPEDVRSGLMDSVFDKTFSENIVKAHHINPILTKDGEQRIISWNNTVYRDIEGNVVGTTSLGEDITERIRAEEALRKSERLLANAQRMAQLGSWEWDVESGDVYWTQEVFDIYGQNANEFLPDIESVTQLFHPDFRDMFQTALTQANDGKENFNFEAKILWPDGTERYITSTSMGYRDAKGNVYRISGTVQDITERKLAEIELVRKQENLEAFVSERTAELAERMRHVEQLNKGMVNLMQDLQNANQRSAEAAKKLYIANTELENFAYSVSHDLRAPLRSISGFAQILSERHSQNLDEQGQQYIEYIVSASIQMGRLIDDLLQYSRLGRRAVQTRLIDTRIVFDEVIKDLHERIEKTGARITLPDNFPEIESNYILLKQIILNLMDNAMVYQEKNTPPEITVSCVEESEYAIFSIQDNGIGIEKEYFETIFNMFQRLHPDDEYSGTGIGLALVKKAVTLLNGEIWVDSELHAGSTFWVKMPVTQRNAAAEVTVTRQNPA